MKKKFVGPPNPGPDGAEQGHEVVVAGRSFGLVKPGEVVELPDELVAPRLDPKTKAVKWPGVEFPAALWEDVAERPKQEKKKDGEG